MRIEDVEGAGDAGEALQLILGALNADGGTVHLLGSDGILHLEAAVGVPRSLLDKIQTIPVGKGMAGLAVERGEPIDTCNLQSDPSDKIDPGARSAGLAGAIVVPIFDGDRPVGALGVANREERNFSPEERDELMRYGRALLAWARRHSRHLA
jgi:L-methionine (R)-S-oxide reductase